MHATIDDMLFELTLRRKFQHDLMKEGGVVQIGEGPIMGEPPIQTMAVLAMLANAEAPPLWTDGLNVYEIDPEQYKK